MVLTNDYPDVCVSAYIVPSPLDAYRGRGKKTLNNNRMKYIQLIVEVLPAFLGALSVCGIHYYFIGRHIKN